MSLIKKILYFFKKTNTISPKENHKNFKLYSLEESAPLNADDGSEKDLKESMSEQPPTKSIAVTKKKKRKKPVKKIIIPESREKIRKINSDEDLYELFTGDKNPGVSEAEYSPSFSQINQKLNVQEMVLSYPPPQKNIDLHGMTSIEAEKKIDNELITAKMGGLDTIIFITGKGTHSKGGESVLKKMAEQKAISLKKDGEILTFRWEKKQKKKSGAIIFYI